MRVTVFRTAMIGGGLAYDVSVRTTDVPNYDGSRYTTIHRDNGRQYVDFPAATLPEAHFAMPQGIERYEAWLSHERAAKIRMLAIARTAFPELNRVDRWPELWATGLLGEEKETSATVEVHIK